MKLITWVELACVCFFEHQSSCLGFEHALEYVSWQKWEKKRKSETSFNQGCLLPLTVLLINKAGIILLLFIFHAVFDCLHLAKPERDLQNQAEGTYSRDRKVCSGSGM